MREPSVSGTFFRIRFEDLPLSGTPLLSSLKLVLRCGSEVVKLTSVEPGRWGQFTSIDCVVFRLIGRGDSGRT